MENEELTLDEAQQVWDEEAAKLDAGDEPAPEPEAAAPEEPPQEEPAPAKVQAPEQPSDPLAGLPPDVVKAKLAQIDQLAQANAQLMQHVRSAEGRVAAMQREMQAARAAQQSVAPQDAPSKQQMSAAAKTPEKWEQLKKDFPDWADAMEEFVSSKLSSQPQQPAQPQVDPRQIAWYVQQQVAQTRAEMGRRLEEARVESKYENWRDTVNTTEFAQWFAVQPPEVKALADSPVARDALRMLDLFSATKARSASDIKQERGARLAAAATTRPGQTPPPKTMDEMSLEEIWEAEARKRERTRAERGF